MREWLHHVEWGVKELASNIPLELFVFIGSCIEEIVAPIPSMLVMTTTGLFAHMEGRTTLFVVWLVILGNFGKLIGSWLYYSLGDKLEDAVVGKCGRFFGFSHEDMERIGARFTGKHWRDGSVIFLLRALPFVPTILVSIACGVIKINLRVFFLASYLGNFCKDLFYAFAGYYGARALKAFFLDIERMRWGIGTLLILTLIAFLVVAYMNRHRGQRFFVYVCSRFGKRPPSN